MRRLSRKKALTLMKELDAFPKVPESCVESTASGGTVSLLAFSLMALLAVLEFLVFRRTWMKYEYQVDRDFNSKLRINLDVTVAMRCKHLGADVLDVAGNMLSSEGLEYDAVNFDLSPEQRSWHTEENSRSLHACRIHGNVLVNKVAGNFHVTVGRSIPHPRGHAHLSATVSQDTYNFSHRIDHLSFGEQVPGLIGALDGTAEHMFQYFLTVVPTRLTLASVSAHTHQFSVTEWSRVVNPTIGYHGASGIFLKFDLSALSVSVTEQRQPLWKFLVRLCGIIGGVFSTTGMLHGALGVLVDCFCCRLNKRLKNAPQVVPVMAAVTSDLQ